MSYYYIGNPRAFSPFHAVPVLCDRWTVGFYDPLGNWHAESYHPTADDAADRTARLNGAALPLRLGPDPNGLEHDTVEETTAAVSRLATDARRIAVTCVNRDAEPPTKLALE